MHRYLRWIVRWLRRQWQARRRDSSTLEISRRLPVEINPRDLQPPVCAFGLDIETVREWFAAISIDGSAPGDLSGYARQDLERFLRTVELVPIDAEVGIEIGANPYFTTTLLRWFRPDLKLSLTNYFGDAPGTVGEQTVSVRGIGGLEERTARFVSLNVETEAFPFNDASVDVVLYCEVLEHMTNDPRASLLEIARVLKPGGKLVLTTPNAARIENVTRAIAGLTVQDQYSGYGPYGRHNREYTVDEVKDLLSRTGFVKDTLYTADVHPNHAALFTSDPKQLIELCGHRRGELGQYIFSRWHRSDEPLRNTKPAWLYRSYASDLLDDRPLGEPVGARF